MKPTDLDKTEAIMRSNNDEQYDKNLIAVTKEKDSAQMNETLTSDDVINEVAEVLRQGNGAFIEHIANQVLVPNVRYIQDSIFYREKED